MLERFFRAIITAMTRFRFSLVIVMLLAWFLTTLLLASFELGILIIIVLVALTLLVIISSTIKDKTFFLWFIFLFPLLPFHIGFDPMPGLIPVLRPHRILVAFMLLFWFINSGNIKESIRNFPLAKVSIFVIMAMFISAMCSEHKFFSLFYIGTFVIEYFLFAVMFFDLVRDEKTRNRIFFLITLSALIASIVGIAEYYTGKNIYSLLKPFRLSLEYATNQQLREGAFRIKGAFDHSISYGVFLSLSSISVLYLYAISKKINRKFFYASILFIIGYAIFLTRSRIALLAFCISSIIILLFKLRKEFLFLLVVLLFFLIQPFFANELKKDIVFMVKGSIMPFQSGTSEMIGSSVARIQQFDAMRGIIEKNPVIGYGKTISIIGSVDNFYLLFVSRFGVVGLALFAILIIAIFREAYFLLLNGSLEQVKMFGCYMLAALLSVVVVWMAVSLESYFYLFWIYVGLLMRTYVDERSAKA